jgi:hypothetical protein
LNEEVQRQNVQHPGPNNAPTVHPPAEQVSKVFRPPMPAPKPAQAPPEKQVQGQQQKQVQKKQ